MNERIERIEKMEALLHHLSKVVQQAEQALALLEQNEPALQELTSYYTSPLWMEDFQADERGELPREMKRGVLSEDGIDHLLWQHRHIMDQMKALSANAENNP